MPIPSLSRILGVSLLIVSLAACGGPSDTSSPTASQKADTTEGVVYHRGNGSEPNTLDPHQANGQWENNIIGDLMLGLFTEDMNGKAMPGAAISHEVSEDGLTHIFKMREGALWSDGTPVTAHDFIFSWQHILDPATAASYASLIYPFKNAAAINAGEMPVSALGARAIDDFTIELITETPVPFLKTLLTHYTAFPVPKHVVEAKGDDWVKVENYVSNGAYKLVDWRPNSFVKLVKNENFYDAKNVSIDTTYFYPIDDPSAALRKFRAGELDSNSCSQCYPIQQKRFIETNLKGVKRDQVMLSTSYITFNTNNAPFDDARVRRAVGLIIDRDVMTGQVLRSGEIPAYSLIPPDINNYVSETDRPAMNEAKMTQVERNAVAKALLAEVGFGPENPLSFTVTYRLSGDRKQIMVAIQNMWKEQGVIAQLEGKESKVAYADYRARNFEVADAGWVADYNDPNNFLFLGKSDTGPINYADYNNPEFDRLINEANSMQDLKARAKLLVEAEQLMMDEMPLVPIYFTVDRNLVGNHVKGWRKNGLGTQRTRWLSLDESAREIY